VIEVTDRKLNYVTPHQNLPNLFLHLLMSAKSNGFVQATLIFPIKSVRRLNGFSMVEKSKESNTSGPVKIARSIRLVLLTTTGLFTLGVNRIGWLSTTFENNPTSAYPSPIVW
jgi:hypothetical protein